uniref:Uncharacterized protein n=1 Tax=Anguilla anguilla TaxID=7936 RepID=A0A0E9XQF4_ANGAN
MPNGQSFPTSQTDQDPKHLSHFTSKKKLPEELCAHC